MVDVPFNPGVNASGDFNTLNYARVIDGPKPDLSSAIRNKAFADAIGDLPSIADKWMSNEAKNKTEANMTALQDEHIKNLQDATQPTPVLPQPTTTGQVQQPLNLLDSQASANLPVSVQSGMQRIATLNSAIEGGKVNDTLLTAQAYAKQKQLRNEFPNYRTIVDSEAARVLGKDPANAYAANMLQDLNQARTDRKSQVDKVLTEISKYAGYSTVNGVDMHSMYDYVQKNGVSAIPNAMSWVDQVAKTEVENRQRTNQLALRNLDDDQARKTAETNFSKTATDLVNNKFYAHAAQGSLNSPDKIQEKITDEGINPGTHSATEMEEAGRMMLAHRNSMEAQLYSEASKPILDPVTGKPSKDSRGNTYTYATLLGPTGLKAQIDAALRPYDISSNAALNDKTGTATYAATHAQRLREDLDNGITSNPTNKALGVLSWLNKNAGPQLTDTIYRGALTTDVDNTVRNLLTDKTTDALSGGAATGNTPNFKSDVEKAKNGVDTNGKPIDPNTHYYERLGDNIYKLLDPDVPDNIKMNTVKYYFSPQGIGVLQNFKDGYYDKDHNWVAGKEALWQTLTNESVTKEIARLGNLPGGAVVKQAYKNFVEQEFSQSIFSSEIHNLNEPPQFEGKSSKTFENVRVGWINQEGKYKFVMLDQNNKYLDPDYKEGPGSPRKTPRPPVDTMILNHYQDSLDRLNAGIGNLATMQKYVGKEDTGAYLLDLLTRSGFAPDENVQGLPKSMSEAIVNSHKKSMPLDIAVKGKGTTPPTQGLE